MTVSNIILNALRDIVSCIEKLDLKYCLFGGLAMQAYKRIRATMDIDLLISISSEEIPKFILQLEKKNFKFDKDKGVRKIGNFEFIRFLYTDKEYQIDIPMDFVSSGTIFQEEILSRRLGSDILGVRVYIASCEDLILLKLLAGRPLDKADAEVLVEENKEDLDKEYLRKWARELGVERRLLYLLKY